MSCQLCTIPERERDRVVIETQNAFCVVNIEPLVDGHIMVLPRKHITQWKDLSSEESSEIFTLVSDLSDALQRAYKKDAALSWIHHGTFGSQEHIHLHIMPKPKEDFEGGMRGLASGALGIPLREKAEHERLVAICEKVKTGLRESESQTR